MTYLRLGFQIASNIKGPTSGSHREVLRIHVDAHNKEVVINFGTCDLREARYWINSATSSDAEDAEDSIYVKSGLSETHPRDDGDRSLRFCQIHHRPLARSHGKLMVIITKTLSSFDKLTASSPVITNRSSSGYFSILPMPAECLR